MALPVSFSVDGENADRAEGALSKGLLIGGALTALLWVPIVWFTVRQF